MDPTYTTTDPTGLFLTTSGLALDSPGATGVLEPILYDPATMSTPWIDPASGVNVAMQQDGTIVPVAIRAADIQSEAGLPSGVTNLLATGVQSFATQLQHWLNPATAYPAGTVAPTTVGGGILGNPMALLAIGAIAYFALRKK